MSLIKILNQVLALKNYHFLFGLQKKKKYRIANAQKLPEKIHQKSICQTILLFLFFLFLNNKKIHHVEIYPWWEIKHFVCSNYQNFLN